MYHSEVFCTRQRVYTAGLWTFSQNLQYSRFNKVDYIMEIKVGTFVGFSQLDAFDRKLNSLNGFEFVIRIIIQNENFSNLIYYRKQLIWVFFKSTLNRLIFSGQKNNKISTYNKFWDSERFITVFPETNQNELWIYSNNFFSVFFFYTFNKIWGTCIHRTSDSFHHRFPGCYYLFFQILMYNFIFL